MLHDPRREADAHASLMLAEAADYLQEHGWCQHAMRHDGRVCLLGALDAVCCGQYGGAVDRLRRLIGTSIAHWNDEPGRTKEEVIGVLRKAALL